MINNLDNHERVLKNMLTSYAKQIRTAIPATIVEFDSSIQRAKVQIDIEEQFGDKYEKPAVLEDVPVAFPRVKDFVITMPVKKGDKVMLVFAHASIDKWNIDGTSNNKDTRTHNISDAVVYLDSIRPENDPIKNFDTKNMVLRSINNNTFIKIKKREVEIKADLLNVKNKIINIESPLINIKTKMMTIDGNLTVLGKILPYHP